MDPSSRLRPVTAWSVSMDLPSASDTAVREHGSPGASEDPARPQHPAGRPDLGPWGSWELKPRDEGRGTRDAQASCRDGTTPSPGCPARARHCSQGPCRSTQKWLWRSGPSWAGQRTPGVRGKGAARPWTVAWRDPEPRVTSARGRRGGREVVTLRTPIGTAFRLCQMQAGRSQG